MGKFSDFLNKARGSEADSSGDSAPEANQDLASVRSELRGNRKRISKIERDAANADLQRDLDKLYTPENWKAIATMYHDARYVSTGHPAFRLSDDTQNSLGVSLAASARLLLKIDPGYIALIIFTSNLGKAIAISEAQYSASKKAAGRAAPGPRNETQVKT
jgi:hypothetical protein